MISKHDLIDFFKRKGNQNDSIPYRYDEETDSIFFKNGTKQRLCNMDVYTQTFQQDHGMSFYCLYDDHVGCTNVLECTMCHTVIFNHYDEGYDPNLQCPTCTDYKTYFEFWTKEQIEHDEQKQSTLKMFEVWNEWNREREKRIEKRNGKRDWELAKIRKLFETKNGYWSLEINIDSIVNKFKLKGMKLVLDYWKKQDDRSATWRKNIIIPLSWSAFYTHCIYKHLGKCHPDIRSKYYMGKAK